MDQRVRAAVANDVSVTYTNHRTQIIEEIYGQTKSSAQGDVQEKTETKVTGTHTVEPYRTAMFIQSNARSAQTDDT